MERYFELLKEYNFDEAERIRQEQVPKKIYKYYWLSDNDSDGDICKFDTLERNCVWLSSVERLNDPYEFRCMYIDEEALKEQKYPVRVINAYKKIFEKLRQEVCLTSFTQNDQFFLPMWAYYSNNHSGFCVEYDVLNPKNIYKISYEPKRIGLARLVAENFNDFIAERKGKDVDDNLNFSSTVFMHQFFMKHESWSHERQYRIVYPVGEKVDKGCYISTRDIGIAPKKIYAGYNCTKRNIGILNSISNSLGCGNVIKLRLSDNDFIFEEEQ